MRRANRRQYIFILAAILTASFSLPAEQTIDELLKNPFDLQKFKKVKGQSNSGGADKKDYYYKPKEKGIYYHFFLFDQTPKGYVYLGSDTLTRNYHSDLGGIHIITYKPIGKYQWDYLDPTETLIEVFAKCNDRDLPELSYVGLDTTTIKNRLGNKFIRKDSCFIYSKDNHVLTLKLTDNRVLWLKYTRLNFPITKDNVPAELLTEK